MHSAEILISKQSTNHIRWFAHHVWNQRLVLKDSIYRSAVYLEFLSIDDSSRSDDFAATVVIVHTGKRSSLTHVPGHSEIMDAVERD
jgi:hypothetical protein